MKLFAPALFMTMVIASGGAMAADATITITGKVVARPCTVSTTSASVDLGDMYAQDLSSAGSASAWKDVTLELTGCPVGTSSVIATFSGTADSVAAEYYANNGTATNLQLQLQDSGGLNLSNGTAKTVAVTGTSVSIPLQVRALSVNGNTTQGTVQGAIDVNYTYQ
ncbi:fimbrial protein [Citrobacter sp. Awk 4]|uniref:fimbrial protein n=1 Tax=Citrobacter sp. Awk 4 TaxID=2963955 RepID=UPI002FE2E226